MFEFQLAKRLYTNKEDVNKISKPAVFIAKLGIAIGFIVMLITVAVVIGFKGEIRNKAIGFNHFLSLFLIALSSFLIANLKSNIPNGSQQKWA